MVEADLVAEARPAKWFAMPPYRAEWFSHPGGWAGVMNAQGVNCLTFRSKPGAVITSLAVAQEIAERWNKEAGHA